LTFFSRLQFSLAEVASEYDSGIAIVVAGADVVMKGDYDVDNEEYNSDVI